MVSFDSSLVEPVDHYCFESETSSYSHTKQDISPSKAIRPRSFCQPLTSSSSTLLNNLSNRQIWRYKQRKLYTKKTDLLLSHNSDTAFPSSESGDILGDSNKCSNSSSISACFSSDSVGSQSNQFLATPTTPHIPLPINNVTSCIPQGDTSSSSPSSFYDDKDDKDLASPHMSVDWGESILNSPSMDLSSSWTPSISSSSNPPGSPGDEDQSPEEDPLMTAVILSFENKLLERLQFNDVSNYYQEESYQFNCGYKDSTTSHCHPHNYHSELYDSTTQPSNASAFYQDHTQSASRLSDTSTNVATYHTDYYASSNSSCRSVSEVSRPYSSSKYSVGSSSNGYRRVGVANCNRLAYGHHVGSSIRRSNAGHASGSSQPRKKHLLQFIVDILNDPNSMQTSVQWVSRTDRVFRICDPAELTHMWGDYKNNMNMSFESLSRSLRLYYAPGKLERIQGRRHQYRLLGNSLWPVRG